MIGCELGMECATPLSSTTSLISKGGDRGMDRTAQRADNGPGVSIGVWIARGDRPAYWSDSLFIPNGYRSEVGLGPKTAALMLFAFASASLT
jgi:hypothetical protein